MRSKKMSKLAVLFLGLVLGLTLTACGSDSSQSATTPQSSSTSSPDIDPDAQPLTEPVEVTVGVVATINAAPVWVADAKGYFAQEKIKVTVTNIPTVSAVQPLLATGRLDVAYGLPSPGLFNGLATGQDVRLVSSAGQPRKGKPASAAIVLKDGPIKTLEDLRGKSISVAGGIAGASAWYLSELLKQADMTVDDVRLVTLGSADGVAALKNGAVHATMALGPDLVKAMASGEYELIGDMYEVLKNGTGGAFIFGSRLIKDDRQVGAAFLRALLKATREDLQDGYFENEEILAILGTALNSPPAVLKQTYPPTFDPDLTLPSMPFESMQAFWRAQGQLDFDEDLEVGQIIDSALMETAATSAR